MVIVEAGRLMGIQGFADDPLAPAFAKDLLQIQSEADVDTVNELVDSYISDPRSLILAVVQAGNDIANQPVVRKCKKFDAGGERTIGVITKPDLINRGAEARIASLARNEDTTRLKLEFFLLKNLSPEESRNASSNAREHIEREFFEKSPWKEQDLDRSRLGSLNLTRFLQTLLDHHVERELPKVREELRRLEKKTLARIEELGEARSTIAQMRMYLSRLAMRLDHTCSSALQGDYSDHRFFSDSYQFATQVPETRLRAVIHLLDTRFSDGMRTNGKKLKIVDADDHAGSIQDPPDEETMNRRGQILVTEGGMRRWMQQVYTRTRGRELPGDYNHIFLAELYHQQSSRWGSIAEQHVERVHDSVVAFVRSAVEFITDEEHTRLKLTEHIMLTLEAMRSRADHELRLIKARNDGARKAVRVFGVHDRHSTARYCVKKAGTASI
ncbi:Putative dynamin stalk domain, P-loop containing nucleoside triphosphate hydrolase [Septoria linicola]|uniref:Dynamin stalk domain, P-loop containing nucleoside triphosphate hydrolase n=1 Tax=Septoria linicola TaxID=215465 RepID=A0A9Q9EME5_9PEZI|nr:Putative dynamin stalk domain, P-loop containing nucleoside triphosphate hydrolase [Septoria linicola]